MTYRTDTQRTTNAISSTSEIAPGWSRLMGHQVVGHNVYGSSRQRVDYARMILPSMYLKTFRSIVHPTSEGIVRK